ncbi:Uncharacterised protein [Acinetobacter baumannii]|nr:Uncharacterised protein [Acinetobacter baumannii]
MKKLLGNQIEIINSLKKAEVQISYFELPKNINKIEIIVSLLEKDGWVLKGKGQGVDTYCLGKIIELILLYQLLVGFMILKVGN